MASLISRSSLNCSKSVEYVCSLPALPPSPLAESSASVRPTCPMMVSTGKNKTRGDRGRQVLDRCMNAHDEEDGFLEKRSCHVTMWCGATVPLHVPRWVV